MRKLLALLAFSSSLACTHSVTGSGDPSADAGPAPGARSSADVGADTGSSEIAQPEEPFTAASGGDGGVRPTVDVTGRYCGKRVAVAEECVGEEAVYVSLLSAGSYVAGDLCDSYEYPFGRQCLTLRHGNFDGTTLTFEVDATDKHIWGSFTVLEARHLTGRIRNSEGYNQPFTLYRLRDE